MGIFLMENFDVSDLSTLAADRALDAVPSGSIGATGFLFGSATLPTEFGLRTFMEKGIRRTSVGMMGKFEGANGSYGGYLRIPIPSMVNGQANANLNRSFYLSMRMRFLVGTNATTTNVALATPIPYLPRKDIVFGMTAYPSMSFGSAYQVFAMTNSTYDASGKADKMRIFFGPWSATTSTQTEFSCDADGWFHVELFKPAGSTTFTFWVNDFMYTAGQSSSIPEQFNANTMFMNLYIARLSTLNSPIYYGIEATDVIVIDPNTSGQKYRFGSSGRVLSMDYTSDFTADWAADPSATLTHHEMMMIDQSTPAATNILTGTTIGQREQYAMKPIPTEFGPYVPAVLVRPRVMNGGAAAHSLAMEMDWGTGIAEVSERMVLAGGAYDATPLIMTTKPNGDPWTAADFASAKAGFSVKS
ncbi:hypothetical protein JT354_gp50 [Serratia phage JS26]|uniref:Uncharacterized protein n=1 Tax=Serratia phage JS26 TaxID=2315217 RepID=A0A5Q2F381_9CAUD|nr:hypothetical protein JT354_gp50 [Serratia phage JS26]QGF20872.1 hypothetical protein [Serratia phage JS26]